MQRTTCLALVALAALISSAGRADAKGRDPHRQTAERNGWRTDLRAARAEARKANKPLMIVLRCFD